MNKHLDMLRKINVTDMDPNVVERIMSEYFNMKCDHCDEIFKSLPEAQYHYMHVHDIADGYVKCCGHTFKKNLNINGHVLYHLNPDIFKYVQQFPYSSPLENINFCRFV